MGFEFETKGPLLGTKRARVENTHGKPRKGKTEHVRMRPPSDLACMHCGETYRVNMPAPLNIMMAVTKAFTATHRQCAMTPRGPACGYCMAFGHAPSECPSTDYGGDPSRWASGPDTGLSSMTIFRKMMNQPMGRCYVPRDPDDFGRCHRLLHAIPGWRARILEMVDVPGWEHLAKNWDELEKLFLEEIPKGRCPKLYARMKALPTGGGS